MKALLLLSIAPVTAIWYGFALSVMWAWFVVPMFQVAPLRIPYAIGIAYTVQFLTHQTTSEENEPDTGRLVLMAFLKPLVLLISGWVVTWFL